MTYQSGTTCPENVSFTRNLGRRQYTVNFDIKELEDGTFEWCTVTLNPGEWSYGAIIAAIIDSKYSPNELQAINANMLGVLSGCFDEFPEEKVAEYKDECRELALWRDHAKEIAKEALKYNPT